MKFDVEKALKEIDDYFSKASNEDIKRDILCLNGKMTEDIFDEVIKEDVYDSQDFHIDLLNGEAKHTTSENFSDVINYIETVTPKEYVVNISVHFPEYAIYFEYKSNHYVWNVIHGQGSIYSLYKDDTEEYKYYTSKVFKMYIDPELEFYKPLKK